jgi:hypothetical protein
MKKSKARLEAEAEARWKARLEGPRKKSLLDIRRVTPLPPRERGRARMERGVNGAFERMAISGALPPVYRNGETNYVRDSEMANMRMHLEDIASIIEDTIADDDKAGLLMQTIGYALDSMYRLGGVDRSFEPGCRLRDKSRSARLGGDVRGEQQQDEAAEWRKEAWPIWWEKRGQYPKSVRRRKMSQEKLAQEIHDELRDRVPGLPKCGQIHWTIKNVWEKE